MSSWPLNGKKGGNRKHSKIDTLPPEMKTTVEEMIMDGSATYSDIVTYLEQQGYSLSVSSVCRYAQGMWRTCKPYRSHRPTSAICWTNWSGIPIWTPPRRLCVLQAKTL